jgi:hypothetical protein
MVGARRVATQGTTEMRKRHNWSRRICRGTACLQGTRAIFEVFLDDWAHGGGIAQYYGMISPCIFAGLCPSLFKRLH